MGSIRAEGNRLFFDFRYRGTRCRERTALSDTGRNRKTMQRILDKIESEIVQGTFDYAHCFPGSKLAAKFAGTAAIAPMMSATPTSSDRPVGATPLFNTFIAEWFDEFAPTWRASHIATLRSTLDQHLIPYFGGMPVGAITKADILQFRAEVAKRKGRGGNETLSAKTINRIMQILSQALGEAAERYSFINPASRIKRLKQRRVDIHPFSLADTRRIIETVRQDYRPYLTVRFFTGMRTGEVNGLQWRYVDFEQRLILVRETLVRGHIEYTKTDGSQRDIAMSQPVYDALVAQKAVTGNAKFVFCATTGEPIDLDNFTHRVWYPLLRYLDLEPRRPYQTRHTAATLWLASGENPEWVARQLGHANTEMLFKTYSRYVPNLTRSDGAAMERLLAASLHATVIADGQRAHLATIDADIPAAHDSPRTAAAETRSAT